ENLPAIRAPSRTARSALSGTPRRYSRQRKSEHCPTSPTHPHVQHLPHHLFVLIRSFRHCLTLPPHARPLLPHPHGKQDLSLVFEAAPALVEAALPGIVGDGINIHAAVRSGGPASPAT